MKSIRKELSPGVYLNYIHATKFKTGLLSAQLLTPLDAAKTAPGALLPAVLRRRRTRYWRLLAVMTVLFLAGAFFQHYAEGMLILALCLLLRFWIHYRNEK